jgi:hypothetical protein
MRLNSQALLGLALAGVIASVAALAWLLSAHEAPAPAGAVQDGDSDRVAQLEQELRGRDALIGELRDRIQRLEARERTSLPAQLEAAAQSGSTQATPRAPEPANPPAASHAGSTSLVAWLQQLLPDKFASLTAEQVALLESLDLRGAKLTDADLARLGELPRLKDLCLRGTAVTDAGLASLRSLRLASLELRGTRITGDALASLPSETLQVLHLTDTQVRGADLARLPACPELRVLKLNELRIRDADLEALASHPSIRHLELDGTSITAAGVRRLLQFNPRLTRIELRRTGVSVADLEDLRASHPDCELVLDTQVQSLLLQGR